MKASIHLQSYEPQASHHLPAQRLADAARALGLDVQPSQGESLLKYVELLARWNKTYNLTAVRAAEDMWPHHIFDCLAIAKPLRTLVNELHTHSSGHAGATAPSTSYRVWDYGSGAGLPGLILAILWPDVSIDTFDAVAKKVAFQQQVIGELRLANAHAHHARVEALKPDPAPDLIVCRAFTSLANLTRLAQSACGPNTRLAAMKSRTVTDELSELPTGWIVEQQHELQVPELPAERRIVILRRSEH